mgnify:CR=1 FL=1
MGHSLNHVFAWVPAFQDVGSSLIPIPAPPLIQIKTINGCGYFPPPLRQIEYSNHMLPNTAPRKPSNPNIGKPNSVGPPFTVITIDEPMINAAITMPIVSRLAE